MADEPLPKLKQKAPRTVTVTFESQSVASQIPLPDFVVESQLFGNQLSFHLLGSAADFTRWAATLPIADVSIGQPNLETLFRQYYKTELPPSAKASDAAAIERAAADVEAT